MFPISGTCVLSLPVPGANLMGGKGYVTPKYQRRYLVNNTTSLQLSNFFHATWGVRQGSILSSVLFTVFINLIIVRLKDCGFGCIINSNKLFYIHIVHSWTYCFMTIAFSKIMSIVLTIFMMCVACNCLYAIIVSFWGLILFMFDIKKNCDIIFWWVWFC